MRAKTPKVSCTRPGSPVDEIALGGFNGSYAIAGFTKSVPDAGSTVILFGLALVGLVAFNKRAACVQHCPQQLV
jgi:hypothetical protein